MSPLDQHLAAFGFPKQGFVWEVVHYLWMEIQ